MSDVVIHVGMPKSGSSFIQTCFFPALDGIFYVPEKAPHLQAALFENSREAPDADISAGREAIAEARRLAGTQTVLFSSESLFQNENLLAAAPDARYIFIIRRQAEILESSYMQRLHNYGIETVEEFVPREGGTLKATKAWPTAYDSIHKSPNYEKIIGRYLDTAGKDNLLVLPYEKLGADQGGFFEEVCRFLGCESPDRFESRPVNRSYSQLSYRISMHVNRFMVSDYHDNGFIKDKPMFDYFLKHRQRSLVDRLMLGIVRRISLRWFLQEVVDAVYYRKCHAFDDELKKEIMTFYEQSNISLDERIHKNLGLYGYY